ncbi:RES family NAD+ phosphorylase [Chromobacterium sp. CV08]|uniref:RES family NAD+ phosphorylase n=1 Tax=Chromobacterium sp. CV08 TaxID=3133274 RepID=UPI003DA9FB5B
MIGWRISNYADLNGLGGLRADGRWHHAGRPVVYLADHAASAMLEMLVHSELRALPARFQLLKVELPDEAILDLDPAALPDDWRARQQETRRIGDAWLARAPSALLRVPSALAVDGWNLLLNPQHPDAARCRIADVIAAPLDGRLRPA